MTDPIVQNQNGQNPQTVQTTTPEIDFDLNLPTNDESVSTEEPVVSLDFSDLGITETTTTPTQEAQPKTEDLQQNSINSIDTISLEQSSQEGRSEETKPVQETIETTPETQEIQPVIETKQEIIEAKSEIVQPLQETTEVGSETMEIKDEIIDTASEDIKTQPEIIEAQPETTINPIDEIATQLPPQPQEEVLQQSETKDNRLEQEDALVAESKTEREPMPVIEAKEIPEIKTDTLNVFEQTTETEVTPITEEPTQEIQETTEIINSEKPMPGQPEQNFPPTTNLQQDQAIIQQLQASAGKIPEAPSTIPTAPTSTEVNLDDLLNSPVSQQTTNTQQPTAPIPQQTPTQNTMPAFTGIQGYSLPPIATQLGQAKQTMNKKILINFGIGIIALVVGGFMFKTMYPLEYQKLIGKTSETTIQNGLTDTSAPIEETTETPAATDGLFENPALANYHAAAEDESGTIVDNSGFNAFEDIEQTMDQDTDKIKEQLQNYIDQGKKYLVLGKKTNDKEITKYGLFLYKKASVLLVDIENGTQISTDEINAQLADFETYLQKLTGTGSHDETILQQPTTPTPEEFFGSENSGATEEVTPTPTEIPTTESGTTTQETETPIENLSGNENPILQSNDLNG